MQMFQIKVGLQSHYGQINKMNENEQLPLPPASEEDITMHDDALEKHLTQTITKLKKNKIALLSDIDKLSEEFLQINMHTSEKLAHQIGIKDIDSTFKNPAEYPIVTLNSGVSDPFIEELSELSDCL